MPIDPRAPMPSTPEARNADKLAELERRLSVLENGAPTIQAGTGAPGTAPRDGTPYAQDSGTGFLWVRIGGAWRKAPLS